MTMLRLSAAALFPVILAAALYLIEKKTALGKSPHWLKQLIAGLLFGAAAITATHFGIPVDGAIVNVRTAAPLTAGLLFGGPAGVIAGVIGGVHRWFAVLWGVGAFTQIACSVATILAGILGAFCRRFMFDNKKASWFYGLAIGLTAEVLHMLLIFLTHMDDITAAYNVVSACAPLMITFNSISVMLALLVVSLIGKERAVKTNTRGISQIFQYMLLCCVVLAFVITCVFTYALQTRLANSEAEDLLELNIRDVENQIQMASDNNLMSLTRKISGYVAVGTGKFTLMSYAKYYDVAEINIIDESGVIVSSTNDDFIGFDMASGKQSAEFLCLLSGEESYVQSYQPVSFNSSISRKYAGVALPTGGFVQVGYDAERFQRELTEQVRGAAKNRHVGKNGVIVICDDNLIVVSDTNNREGESLGYELPWKDQSILENKRFKAEIQGVESYCMYTRAEGYYIIAAIPLSEALFSRNIAVYILVFMEILVFAALFAQIYHLIKTLIVDNIHKINYSLAQITGGNLNVTVDVRENEEFASLSDDINSTVSTLKHYIAEAEARIDKELEIGRQIQHSALPSVFPPFPERDDFEIFAWMDAAKEVGGDFYDFYLLENNCLAFIVADVSGKGIPGAMFMMTAKTLIKSLVERGREIDEAFTLANQELCENNDAGMFVTAWIGKLNLATGVLQYVNAGHNPPLIRRSNGAFEYLRTRPNFILAGMEGVRYRKHELQLQPGDEIFLYTDGVTEATDKNQCLYGEERLQTLLSNAGKVSSDELCRLLREDIDLFVGEAPQFDDITMLSVRLNELDEASFVSLRPSMESVPEAAAFLERKLEELEIPMKTAMRVQIALDEIYSNIVRYSGADSARLRVMKNGNILRLIFEDNGSPFDPTSTADPDITLSVEEREIGGLGLMMVRKFARAMRYERVDNKNFLTVEYSV